jgi:hypothetical protein
LKNLLLDALIKISKAIQNQQWRYNRSVLFNLR